MEYGNYLIEIYEHANNHKATTTANQKKRNYLSYFFFIADTTKDLEISRIMSDEFQCSLLDLWKQQQQQQRDGGYIGWRSACSGLHFSQFPGYNFQGADP
jgi:hypothetical protein